RGGLQLHYAHGKPAIILVNVQDYSPDDLTFLQDFGRMNNPLRPGQVGDVNQSVDSFLNFDEGSEVGQLANTPFNNTANTIAIGNRRPRICFQLFDTQRYAALFRLDF